MRNIKIRPYEAPFMEPEKDPKDLENATPEEARRWARALHKRIDAGRSALIDNIDQIIDDLLAD